MFKLIDIVGFRATSTTCGYIEKIYDVKSKKNVFILVFTSDFTGDDLFYFKNDTVAISRFFNLLKNNGSSVITRYSTGEWILIGKKLSEITTSGKLHELVYYNEEPFIQLEELGEMEETSKSLKKIFAYMTVEMGIFN